MNLHAVLKLLLVRRQCRAGILAGSSGCRQGCWRYRSTPLLCSEVYALGQAGMKLSAVSTRLLVRRQGSAGILAGNRASLFGCRRYRFAPLLGFDKSAQELAT